MIDSRRLLDTFLTILRIDSYHPNEDPVIDALRPRLEGAGVRLRADPHRNAIGFWPGSGPRADEEPILLCAHTDTVRPTPGMEPVIRDGAVHTDGSSVLGADDKAGVAAIVEAVEAIADEGAPHPPVEVLFTVGEDVGHIGSKAFDVAEVRSRMAFVTDVDGPVGGIIMAGPTAESFRVTFRGRAAHAGTEPEEGRSALQMAARAIDRMQLGRIDEETTANAGVLTGGEAANIIPPDATLTLQVRSLDQGKFRAHREALLDGCRQAAEAFGGTIHVESLGSYDGYRFGDDDAPVRRAEAAIRSAGLAPWRATTCGGSDANEFNAKGLPTVVISVGYLDIHTNQESMPIAELDRLAEVCRALMFGT
jgi:tripeptide aminopeptidase